MTEGYPYIHIGHGLTAARSEWSMVLVLRSPLDGALPGAVPVPLNQVWASPGSRLVELGHIGSLETAVAGGYPGGSDPAHSDEATPEQWLAFNTDVDEFLDRIHRTAPIEVAIRLVDEEYGTRLSDWHTWSCGQLLPVLPELATQLMSMEYGRRYLREACRLWRENNAKLPIADQAAAIAAIPHSAWSVFTSYDTAPVVVEPRPAKPTDEDRLRAWESIPPGEDVFEAYQLIGLHSGNPAEWDDLRDLGNAFDRCVPTPERTQQLIDLCRRALASPACKYGESYWRPKLVKAYLAAGRLREAGSEMSTVTGNVDYNFENWDAIISYLDAAGRPGDADAIAYAAARGVRYFRLYAASQLGRPDIPKKSPVLAERASQVVLALLGPAMQSLQTADHGMVSNIWQTFGNVLSRGSFSKAVVPLIERAMTVSDMRNQERDQYEKQRLAEARRWFNSQEPPSLADPEGLRFLIGRIPYPPEVFQRRGCPATGRGGGAAPGTGRLGRQTGLGCEGRQRTGDARRLPDPAVPAPAARGRRVQRLAVAVRRQQCCDRHARSRVVRRKRRTRRPGDAPRAPQLPHHTLGGLQLRGRGALRRCVGTSTIGGCTGLSVPGQTSNGSRPG